MKLKFSLLLMHNLNKPELVWARWQNTNKFVSVVSGIKRIEEEKEKEETREDSRD